MNLHSNERHDGESWPDYKARRAASKAAIKIMTGGLRQEPFVPTVEIPKPIVGAWWLGQHTNTKRNVERAERRSDKFYTILLSQMLTRKAVRKHKQHKHPLRDINGAFTHVGRSADGRRIWLGGISSMRGY